MLRIFDCSEVFVERPSDLLARAQMWSNYKHNFTVKFLIGITPQGTISYVSDCVGGCMSDKEIVEKSSLLPLVCMQEWTHIHTHKDYC